MNATEIRKPFKPLEYAPTTPPTTEGGQNGLSADLLIERGVVRYVHYGKHAADTLSSPTTH